MSIDFSKPTLLGSWLQPMVHMINCKAQYVDIITLTLYSKTLCLMVYYWKQYQQYPSHFFTSLYSENS